MAEALRGEKQGLRDEGEHGGAPVASLLFRCYIARLRKVEMCVVASGSYVHSSVC